MISKQDATKTLIAGIVVVDEDDARDRAYFFLKKKPS